MTPNPSDGTDTGTHFAQQLIVLVIDDAPETLGFVSKALEDNDMTVLVARSGQEGIDLAQRIQPDVILLDAIMPGMDGFETCRRLKSPPHSQPAPVIFMTGISDPDHIVNGLKAGGVDYVTKPVVIKELVARIRTHINNARAISSARSALAYAEQSVLAFTPDGKLSWGTPYALQIVAHPDNKNVINNDQILGTAQKWLSTLSTQPESGAKLHTAEGLTFTYLGQAGGEIVVRIDNNRNQNDDHQCLMKSFDLTPREAEVLLWLSYGKTNRDIADVLSLSIRTVNKHIENMFNKMGVENRTSAAAMAYRILHDTP